MNFKKEEVEQLKECVVIRDTTSYNEHGGYGSWYGKKEILVNGNFAFCVYETSAGCGFLSLSKYGGSACNKEAMILGLKALYISCLRHGNTPFLFMARQGNVSYKFKPIETVIPFIQAVRELGWGEEVFYNTAHGKSKHYQSVFTFKNTYYDLDTYLEEKG